MDAANVAASFEVIAEICGKRGTLLLLVGKEVKERTAYIYTYNPGFGSRTTTFKEPNVASPGYGTHMVQWSY